MTEDQAKTKVCSGPYAILQATMLSSANFTLESDPGTVGRCCGSNCMAWRWSETKRTAAFLEAVQTRMQAQAKPNFNTATQEVYAERGGQFERTEGYCGLAGAEG